MGEDPKNTPTRTLRPRTLAVRGGTRRSQFKETSEAIFLTSGFVYDSADEAEASFKGEIQRSVYSRFSNPTVLMFEERMALMEGAEACRATATGMAAVHAALMCQLRAGDRLVSSRAVFGSCDWIVRELAPRYGIDSVMVDGRDLSQWEEALSKPTRIVFLETPSNPTLEIIDLEAVCKLAHKAGAIVVVDNVFATPLLQHPLQMGADIVVYSATKHIDGQGRVLGGAVLGSQDFCANILGPFLRNTGPTLSPFNAWVLLKGLETLDLRLERHCANALEVAKFLDNHPKIARCSYPFLPSHPQYELARKQMSAGGSVVTLEIAGGKEAAFKLFKGLQVIDISNNLGDAKTLITHPATTTHQRLTPELRLAAGISDSTVRISVGLEDVRDLIEDLEQALSW
jgi:O-succinylhomoserine sulfhydrylase